jgi:hypothetical protein
VNEENKRLKNLLNNANAKCNSLQMQITLMQQQQRSSHGHGHRDPEQQQQQQLELLPRQFISLGSTAHESARGSDCATVSPSSNPVPDAAMDYMGCPGKSAMVVAGAGKADLMPLPPFEHGHGVHHESGGSPETMQGWLPGKVPKFLPAAKVPEVPPPAPEAAATMRKARVSVRARSEAAMVRPRSSLSRAWHGLGLISCHVILADQRWVPVAEVRAEDGQGQPVPTGLLPVHHGRRLPGAKAGAAVRGGPDGAHHHVRGKPQPPAAACGHADGVHHGGRGIHAAVGVHGQR